VSSDLVNVGGGVLAPYTDLPIFRTSERKAFKNCQWQWWYVYVEGLQKKGARKGALWFGQGIHLALERWYIPGKDRGVDPIVTWLEYCLEASTDIRVEDDDGEFLTWMDAKDLGVAMLTHMLETYGDDDEWYILSPEQTVEVLIQHPQRPGEILVRYVGVFDIVARNRKTGLIWLWDHKTARQIKVSHLKMDEQAGSYWTIAEPALKADGVIGENEHLRGILYNFITKSPPDERPRNADGLYCNKPVKKDYVAALLGLYDDELARHGDPIDQSDIPVELTEKGLNTLKLPELIKLAKKEDLEVFGAPSKVQPAKRFHREEVQRSPKARERQIKRIGEDYLQLAAVRDGHFAKTKNPGDHCNWCPMKMLCEIDEEGGDTEEIIEFAYEKFDPYEQYTTEGKS